MPGAMALRCAGWSEAVASCDIPPHDQPYIPTFPFDHDCCAAISTTSRPSSPYLTPRKSNGAPSDQPPERALTPITAYPLATSVRSKSRENAVSFLRYAAPPMEPVSYPLQISATGNRPVF